MNKQQKRNQLVLERLIEMSNSSNEDAECIAEFMEDLLDEATGNDFFGTEGQLDPRGDQRDSKKVYTMYYVDGIDA